MNLPPRVPAYREWVDDLRRLVDRLSFNLSRPITPMFHVARVSGDVEAIAVDARFFEDRERMPELIALILDQLEAREAPVLCGWTYTATITSYHGLRGIFDAPCALALDAERHETWIKTPQNGWEQLPANEQAGLLLTPIQKGMR